VIRSMSDEQMLAKYGYDKEPWVDSNGVRYVEAPFGHDTGEWFELQPRPECIPSRDPLPWQIIAPDLIPYRTDDPSDVPASFIITWKPRPEFARPPVNPILAAFRDSTGWPDFGAKLDAIRYALRKPGKMLWGRQWTEATTQQIADARRVLERLAKITAVTK
jgi:hypothetical protein